MHALITTFIMIDATAAIFLIIMSFRSDQDVAGGGMIMLPVILLLALAFGAYQMLQHEQVAWALVLSGIPVLILLYLAYISFT